MLTLLELFGSAFLFGVGTTFPHLFQHGVPTPFFENVWESLYCGNGVPIVGGTGRGAHRPMPPHFYFQGAWLPTFKFRILPK